MDVFVARQPIFDKTTQLFAYELLFRTGETNGFPNIDGDIATTSLLSSSFFTVGIEEITGSRFAFINFTEQLLKQGTPNLFPADKLVVEILENVTPSSEVISACRELKDKGYKLALDDFACSEGFEELLEIADIVKIDFRSVLQEDMAVLLDVLKKYPCQLLAEKIETYEDFHNAISLGFEYFQGYFFSRPEILRNKDLSTSQLTLMQLISKIAMENFDIASLEEIVSQDVSISYKLINYLNSPHFGRLQPISSIRQAISFLGQKDFKMFVTLIATSGLTDDKPAELIRLSIIRGHFLEKIGENSGKNGSELFLLGLFSLIDAILDKHIEEVLQKLPISDRIYTALVGREGELFPYLRFMESYESGNWVAFRFARKKVPLSDNKIVELYLESIKWADSFSVLES